MTVFRFRRAWGLTGLLVAAVLAAAAVGVVAQTSTGGGQESAAAAGARPQGKGGGPRPQGAPGGGAGGDFAQVAPVRVDEVISEPMSQTVPVIGRVVARRAGNVAAQVEGAVSEVHVEVGDRVEKGAPLATLDRDSLSLDVELREAALKEVKATVERQRAAMSMANSALDRLERLRGSSAFSSARYDDAQQELVQARGALVEAEARVSSAEAQLKVARLELSRAVIRAPYSGVVTARAAQPGDWLKVGDAVVAMVDDTTLEIEADVPTERIGALSGEAVLRAVFPSGEETTARLRAIVPQENAMTRTRAVRFAAEFGESGVPHAIDETVTVHVPVEADRMVVTVHKDAINQGPEGMNVFVVEGERAQMRPVKLGAAVGPRFVVASGLKPGEMVIVRGNERLQSGQRVSF